MAEIVYEKHFDPTYNAHYYFNPATGESVWELPQGAQVTVVDKTAPAGTEPDAKTA